MDRGSSSGLTERRVRPPGYGFTLCLQSSDFVVCTHPIRERRSRPPRPSRTLRLDRSADLRSAIVLPSFEAQTSSEAIGEEVGRAAALLQEGFEKCLALPRLGSTEVVPPLPGGSKSSPRSPQRHALSSDSEAFKATSQVGRLSTGPTWSEIRENK
uniref:Uncharacterized protein n=1 Tax=Chromera velia CCMP2878 TaxID=1169474 RepID=A0A0G4G4B2_9ALVE|eukprot:Cvel_20075.t1-p1 / transcript=Cvel_20075.t1 / gene=Cvel_20075 / organism=Chromera_velia_CCMP2878 / gene_product=hypothetical protein / transcript_product=hypothetical protein / location=Cvel_scaffold1776:17032-17672(+) / protein_length=155 / sequence_SO=supercontig / SO=protein_coding / is_pseudo=false